MIKDKRNDIYSIKKFDYINYYFQLFKNNKINVDELKKALANNNIFLPKEFDNLPLRYQKNFTTIDYITFYIENEELNETHHLEFCNFYFYYLVENSRKSKRFTQELIDYVRLLGDINVIFLAMKYIKVENTILYKHTIVRDFVRVKKTENLLSFLIELFVKKTELKYIQTRNLIIQEFKTDRFFDLDLNNPKVKLFLYVESLLSCLSKKEANTLKIKFLILGKHHLRPIDYYPKDSLSKFHLRNYDSLLSANYINLITKLAENQPELFDGRFPNGYVALFFALVKGE